MRLACMRRMRPLRTLVPAVVLAVLLAGTSAIARPSATSANAPSRVSAVTASSVSASVAADESAVRILLDAQKAKYRLLDGVTVTMGPTPDGKQAVSYYREGEIIVSPQHVASLQKIMGHEIWHIIDWRDNGRIDWGEAVPPLNAATYLK